MERRFRCTRSPSKTEVFTDTNYFGTKCKVAGTIKGVDIQPEAIHLFLTFHRNLLTTRLAEEHEGIARSLNVFSNNLCQSTALKLPLVRRRGSLWAAQSTDFTHSGCGQV